jgi:predicted nuclease of restriction endonuclease-like (RecB) superfamily
LRAKMPKVGTPGSSIGCPPTCANDFPRTSGFSPRNLKYMRAFAAAWPDFAIVQRSVAQLPWRHNVALLDKLDTADMRLWYAKAAIEQGWSRDVLVHHIEGRFHERAGRAITNFARVLPPPDSDLAQKSTRDPYLFDFVGNADIRRERDLERALIDHVERFLLELGQGSHSSESSSTSKSATPTSTRICCSIT